MELTKTWVTPSGKGGASLIKNLIDFRPGLIKLNLGGATHGKKGFTAGGVLKYRISVKKLLELIAQNSSRCLLQSSGIKNYKNHQLILATKIEAWTPVLGLETMQNEYKCDVLIIPPLFPLKVMQSHSLQSSTS